MWHSLWNDASTLNRMAAALALVAIVLIGMVAMKNVAARPEFAIHSVVVTGKLLNADPSHIASVVHHDLRGTFFTIDVGSARDALQRVAWVRRVSVRREWPARIEIAIEEHQPLARWNDLSLVNTYGEVFDAEFGDDLPSFYAPEKTSGEVAARYREFAALLDRHRDADTAIESITRSARGAWEVKLDDGLVVALGREQVSERWARWVHIGERFRGRIGQGRELVAIDMRYPNGFAARAVGEPPRAPATKGVTPARGTGVGAGAGAGTNATVRVDAGHASKTSVRVDAGHASKTTASAMAPKVSAAKSAAKG